MNRIFEKISLSQWRKDIIVTESKWGARSLNPFKTDKLYHEIKLPTTSHRTPSFEFYNAYEDLINTPFFSAAYCEFLYIPTGIKANLKHNQILQLYPFHSDTYNHHTSLNNSSIIDAEYNLSNEGHIWIAIYNLGPHSYHINHNDKVAKGILINCNKIHEHDHCCHHHKEEIYCDTEYILGESFDECTC
jgi:dUTPase